MCITSRPSQNSASVIWPLTTNSLCSVPNSGLAIRTFLRSRNSLAGSWPAMTGVARMSLATETALDTGWREGVWAGRGVCAAGVAAAGKKDAELTGGMLGFFKLSDALLLRLMIVVNSCLNFSRSATATAGAAVNVKLWPVSSPTSESLSLTCAAPSLLQKRAIYILVSAYARKDRRGV